MRRPLGLKGRHSAPGIKDVRRRDGGAVCAMWRHGRYVLPLLLLAAVQASGVSAQTVQPRLQPPARRAIFELYVRSDDPTHAAVLNAAEQFCSGRRGVLLSVHDLDGEESPAAAQRLALIARSARIENAKPPLFYGCNTVLSDVADARVVTARLEELLRIDAYVRAGCSRCAKAKAYLADVKRFYPAFEVRFRDLVSDEKARADLNRLVKRYRQSAASVPVLHFCNQLVVGFDNAATTGRRINKILDFWTIPIREREAAVVRSTWSRWLTPERGLRSPAILVSLTGLVAAPTDGSEAADEESGSLELPILPPLEELEDACPDGLPVAPLEGPVEADAEAIDLPWLGRIAVSEWGLPVFTIMVGLVDGFNPCAMWVLLFLLSILVNLKDRMRILAVAGTFVLISGAAYFAFMAAWLNVFMLIGYLRPIQIGLGVVAIAIGAIHVKDFFAFKKGISLSIPDSAKPGIYARVRRIVTAENLWGALAAASLLAVFINVVELLCTAGLPALYTEVLTLQGLPAWKNYAYLLLYNVAYMFDDTLMVACVVVTLGKTKMQETQGRWLKLVSGLAIAALGVLMLLKPDWLF